MDFPPEAGDPDSSLVFRLDSDHSSDETLANLALIAAAPCQNAALRKAVSVIGGFIYQAGTEPGYTVTAKDIRAMTELTDALHAAIGRAEGGEACG